MIASGVNLVMTVIGFAVSTMFIVFVCTRLICARIQLNAARRSFPTATRSDLGMLERGLHGLEPVVVAKFPTKKFSDEYFASCTDTQCTVCLSEYQEKDILRILPYCGHFFHVGCIDIWLQQHSTCPVCRISLRDSPERKRAMQPMFSSAIRPHMDSLDLHPYRCPYTNRSFSSRSIDNRRMDPIQEDQLTSELNTAETVGSISIQCNHVPKTSFEESKEKQVESPSN